MFPGFCDVEENQRESESEKCPKERIKHSPAVHSTLPQTFPGGRIEVRLPRLVSLLFKKVVRENRVSRRHSINPHLARGSGVDKRVDLEEAQVSGAAPSARSGSGRNAGARGSGALQNPVHEQYGMRW